MVLAAVEIYDVIKQLTSAQFDELFLKTLPF